MIRLIPDTSIMFAGGFYLESGKWPMIVAAAREGSLRLCIPEVVIRETVARYRKELAGAQRSINRGSRSLRNLTQNRISRDLLGDEEIEVQVAIYDSWFRDTIVELGEILPLPRISHSVLVDGILASRKPFSAGEKGYRDALIWHSVIAASLSSPVTFVTSNSRDFLSPSGSSFADDLLEDLDHAAIDIGRIRPLSTLDPILDELLPLNAGALEQFNEYVRSPTGTKRFRKLVDDFFEERRRVPLDAANGVLAEGIFDTDIEGIETSLELEAVTARPIADESYLVVGKIRGRAYPGGIIWDGDPLHTGWEIWDVLGPQYYVAFPYPQPVSLSFSIKFSSPNKIRELQLERALLRVDELDRPPSPNRSAPPQAGAPVLGQLRWLRSEMSHLLDLTAVNFRWAVRDEAFLRDISNVLLELEPSVAELLSVGDSISLATDNLGSILEEPAGVRRMLQSLEELATGLEGGC